MPITIHPELESKLRARSEAAGVTVEMYIERIAASRFVSMLGGFVEVSDKSIGRVEVGRGC